MKGLCGKVFVVKGNRLQLRAYTIDDVDDDGDLEEWCIPFDACRVVVY